jgi:hypothetical protein
MRAAEVLDHEEETPYFRFLITAFLAYMSFRATTRLFQGDPPLGDGPTPSMTTRSIWIVIALGGFIACVGYALACLAEILAIGAQSAADSALSNAPRWRLAAKINALVARGLASGSGGFAAAASVVALAFAWCPFGTVISTRAHHASDVAYAAATEARAATRRRGA